MPASTKLHADIIRHQSTYNPLDIGSGCSGNMTRPNYPNSFRPHKIASPRRGGAVLGFLDHDRCPVSSQIEKLGVGLGYCGAGGIENFLDQRRSGESTRPCRISIRDGRLPSSTPTGGRIRPYTGRATLLWFFFN